MVTLTEIAAEAGVSPATVSKALRGSNDINKKTIERITALALEMGYSIKKKGSFDKPRTIGILFPELISSYYSRIVNKLIELFREKDIDAFLGISDFSSRQEKHLLGQMVGMKMSGIICITEQSFLSPLIRETIALNDIPIVQIAMNQRTVGHDNICVDEHAGLAMIINHLTQLGHCEIAFFGERYAERRMQYFREAMKDHGLNDNAVFITQIRHWQAGYELADQLLAKGKKQKITAVVAEYDDIALGAMRRFREAGFRVPEDFSIVGFDDANYCRYLPVSLTTVETHIEEMCGMTVETLYKKINNPQYRVVQNISVVPDLICRESTGVLRAQTG
jgi:DNA-binding LacI/PurR family transcriptional regulator